ncbi:hypothetical protein V6N11_056262 [Hibiscus sabdariffa]|uniref:Uncharacterized protein n=1 Tax=Hibiscus sabdariffa TaxID=183260 RepID=A0ABR2T390_9ROSI
MVLNALPGCTPDSCRSPCSSIGPEGKPKSPQDTRLLLNAGKTIPKLPVILLLSVRRSPRPTLLGSVDSDEPTYSFGSRHSKVSPTGTETDCSPIPEAHLPARVWTFISAFQTGESSEYSRSLRTSQWCP